MNICVLSIAALVGQPASGSDRVAAPFELTLEQAVALGTSRSFTLQRSRRTERIAEERVVESKAQLGPRADVSFGVDQSQRYYDFHGTYDYNQQRPQFDASLSAGASYDFDISAIGRRQLRQVRLSRESAAADVAQAANDVATDIRSDYVQALAAQEHLRADSEYLQLLDGLIERARARQPATVAFLESERANGAFSLEQSKQAADLTLSNLKQILRLNSEGPISLSSNLQIPPALPGMARLLAIAEQNRSDLRQSRLRLEQARIAEVQASDSRRPTLRASVFASQAFNGSTVTLSGRDHGRTRTAGAILNFVLPIVSYDGGQLASQQRVAGLQAEQAVADAEEAEERARTEIDQEMIGLGRALERLKRLPSVPQARQALAEAEEQMLSAPAKDAAAIVAQVTNARQNWRTSLLSRTDALTEYYTDLYRLQRSLGTDAID